jgi:hypothetical protein
MEDYDGAILSDDQQVDLLSAWAACYRNKEEYHTAISYENPNEELGQGVILIEKGEYRCRTCNNISIL